MTHTTPEMRALYARAFQRAGAVLNKGDRVRVITCGGAATYTFDRWDPDHGGFFISKSGIEELHPFNITHVNSVPTSFRDAEPALA